MTKSNLPTLPGHGKTVDLTGQKFGCILVLSYAGSNGRRALWKCQCDCGNTATLVGENLRSGGTKSCGCLQPDRARARLTKHGLSSLPEYKNWKAVRQRCLNPNHYDYKDYGGRGIQICKRWDSFKNFLADMGRRPSPKHSVDRWPDTNGNYEPANCRWATGSEQCRNRRTSISITMNGKTQNLHDWADELGLNYGTVHTRISKGWPPEMALFPGRYKSGPPKGVPRPDLRRNPNTGRYDKLEV